MVNSQVRAIIQMSLSPMSLSLISLSQMFLSRMCLPEMCFPPISLALRHTWIQREATSEPLFVVQWGRTLWFWLESSIVSVFSGNQFFSGTD
jgi:hypothetical protein